MYIKINGQIYTNCLTDPQKELERLMRLKTMIETQIASLSTAINLNEIPK